MPIAYGPFSVATQYRLEVTSNIIGWDGITLTTQTTIGIRRVTGSGGGLTGTIPVNIGSETAAGGVGDTTTFNVNFTSTNYVELSSNIVNNSSPSSPWNPAHTYIRIFASVTAASAPAWGNATASVQLDIPTPNQATWPTFTPATFAAGTLITINLPRKVSTYTHDVFYTFGSLVDQPLATAVGTSMTTTPPTALLSEIPSASAGPYTITAVTRTASGSEVGRQSYTGTLTVPSSSVPTVSAFVVSDENATVATQVGAFVQGLSVLKVTSITATASAGATVTDRRLEIEGSSLRINDTKALLNAGSIPMTARAWDSRGLQGTLAGSRTVLAYSAPVQGTVLPANPGGNVFRSTSGGVYQADGAYLTLRLLADVASLINTTERNSMTVRIYTRAFGGTSWTLRNTVTPTTTTSGGRIRAGAQNIVVGGGALYLPGNSYEVRVEIADKFNTLISDSIIPTAYVTVDLNGSSVGIGKMHQRGALDVGGAAYFRGSYTSYEALANVNSAAFGGNYHVSTTFTTGLPAGIPAGEYLIRVDRFQIGGGIDAVSQSLTPMFMPDSVIFTRTAQAAQDTPPAAWDPWTAYGSRAQLYGTDAERLAMVTQRLNDGTTFRTSDTKLEWFRVGSDWFLTPGQVLTSMVGPTTNTIGSGTLVGSVISTPVLPIGQQVKIIASFSQYLTSGTGAPAADIRWRNNAADVTNTTYDGAAVSRVQIATAGTVSSGRGANLLFTTTTNAKVSVGLWVGGGATSGVFGADGTYMRVESA